MTNKRMNTKILTPKDKRMLWPPFPTKSPANPKTKITKKKKK
jgi:hypothetical protein